MFNRCILTWVALPYLSYMGMCRPKGCFFFLSLKTVIVFDNFGLKSGLVFKDNTRAAQYGDRIKLNILAETMFGVTYTCTTLCGQG